MKLIFRILLICIFTSGLTIYANGQSFKVIVNSLNSINLLTKKQVSNFLLKKTTRWSNNTKVQPVDLSSHSEVRKIFSKTIHQKSIVQVRSFWQQSVFSGKASPPPEIKNDNTVINYVKTHNGAIGYVSANTNTNEVKTITVK